MESTLITPQDSFLCPLSYSFDLNIPWKTKAAIWRLVCPITTESIYSVNIGMLIPFSFNFTNCSCTSCSKRIRSAARGDWRTCFPLPKRDAKPLPQAFKRPTGPNWLCGRLFTYLLKHVKKFLSSPIGIFIKTNHRLIVYFWFFRLFCQSKYSYRNNCG